MLVEAKNLEQILKTAINLASKASKIVKKSVNDRRYNFHLKADKTPVTSIELDIELMVREKICKMFPNHGIIGEELCNENPNPHSEYQWTIDPIDGTKNFINQMITPAFMIGVLYKSVPIVGVVSHPFLDLVYHSSFGMGAYCNGVKIDWTKNSSDNSLIFSGSRKMYSKSGDERLFDRLIDYYPDLQVYSDPFSLTQAIHGRIGCVVEFNLKIWDITPIWAMIKELNGAYHIIKSIEINDKPKLYSVIFGQHTTVNKVLGLLKLD